MGGFLANLDADLKKIVAFSTISQISMITLFLGVGLLEISLFHILNHALFKTLIFCCCGVLFLFRAGDQRFVSLKRGRLGKFIYPTLLLRIFRITGYQYSCSFYTKDLFLELALIQGEEFFFFMVITGRMLTLFYCNRILGASLKPLRGLVRAYTRPKFMTGVFIIIFSRFSLILGSLCSKVFSRREAPAVRTGRVVLITVVMLSPFLLDLTLSKYLTYTNVDLAGSKFFLFSFWGLQIIKDVKSFFLNDQGRFKPGFISSPSFPRNMGKLSSLALALFFIVIVLLF